MIHEVKGWSRRRFLTMTGGAATLGLGLGTYAWRIEPHWPEIVRLDLPLNNLPDALNSKTRLQLSDLHVGPVVNSDYLVQALRQASALKPDLIALTGDFMSSRGGEQVDHVARVLEHLGPAPLGRFAVLGNHDYGPGWSHLEVADALCARLAGLGIQVLRNAFQSIAGLQMVGLDDLWGPNFRPTEVLAGAGTSLSVNGWRELSDQACYPLNSSSC